MNEDIKVYSYMVCWQASPYFRWEWKCKTFALKKDAKAFARKYKKDKPYPYIIRSITTRSVFKKDIEVEVVGKDLRNNLYIRY